jgi:hypothetical protein
MFALGLACALAARPAFPIEVQGNEVMPAEVYLAVLDVPEDAVADAQAAILVQGQLLNFLERSGYELASVQVGLKDGAVLVRIDEGHLEKIVFRGRFTFPMVRFKLALDLPHEVFNRPELVRQLKTLSTQLGILEPTWELLPTETVKHEGPQVENLGAWATVRGLRLLHAQQPLELHLSFTEREWSTGPGLDIRISYFDGLELGVNYQGRSLFFNDDRWRVGVMGGAGLRQHVLDQSLYVFPSRLFAEVAWYTPALDEGKKVRPFLWLRGEGLARQRKDLRLENYDSTQVDISANVSVHPVEALDIFVGFGLDHSAVFWLQGVPGEVTPAAPDPPMRYRDFFQLRAEYVFHTGNARWDRRHAVWLDERLFAGLDRPEQPTFNAMRVGYQKVFAFGWHDLWLKARGTWLAGDVLYIYEEPLGDHLRAVFGDIWVRTAASLHGEFRFSLTRDLFKLGVFLDAAAYGEIDRPTQVQTPKWGLAFGPSFNVLVEGMFQLDMAVSFGFVPVRSFANGVHATLIKVF